VTFEYYLVMCDPVLVIIIIIKIEALVNWSDFISS